MMSSISSEDYLKVDAQLLRFPNEIYVAYAVCNIRCGNAEFIVDGQTQVCECCHDQLFRTEVKKYFLADKQDASNESKFWIASGGPYKLTGFDDKQEIYPEVASNSIKFPKNILITYAVCRKGCGNRGLIVEGNTDICEYCGHHMLHTYTRKHTLEKKQN